MIDTTSPALVFELKRREIDSSNAPAPQDREVRSIGPTSSNLPNPAMADADALADVQKAADNLLEVCGFPFSSLPLPTSQKGPSLYYRQQSGRVVGCHA